jgi:Mor family transcriptional regulator
MEKSPIKPNEMVPSWMNQLQSEALPEVYQEMADIIGVEKTVYLAQVYAGTSVYFPKLERALLTMRNQVIQREFDGANLRALARRWNLSVRHLRHIVNPPRAKSA